MLTSLTFAWPWAFLALPLPLLAARWLPRAPGDAGFALRTPFFAAFADSALPKVAQPDRVRLLLAVLAWLLLVAAAARPQHLGAPVEVPLQGRNLMLAVDISGSMQQDDILLGGQRVSRLTAVKAVAGDFLERRVGDRVGLILFAQQAFLQAPLTLDRATVRTLLGESVIGLAGKETAIGDAIGLAVKRLRQQPAGNRTLILLTDGANTAGQIDPLKAAEIAAAEGVRIYTIGVGADAQASLVFGAPIPFQSDLDEDLLKAIAEQTGGRYFRARDLQTLQQIYRILDQIEPITQDSGVYRTIDEWFVWPLGAALVLTALIAVLAAWRHGALLARTAQPVGNGDV